MKVIYPPMTREQHPIPVVVMHWLHVITMAVLIVTGFYIHRPYYTGAMHINQTLHLVFMWVFFFNGLLRFGWGCVGGGMSAPLGSRHMARDCRWFTMPFTRHKTWETVKYYLFLRRTHPTFLKYNPLQTATYLFWFAMGFVMVVTGFALWTPVQRLFLPLTYLLGGLAVVRFIHYMGMWVFLATVAVHIYLAVVESIREIPLMFWWQESPGRVEDVPDDHR